MKSDRQAIILNIIAEQEIETQNQLQTALEEHGISTTQATLSRDIKDLHLSKRVNSNGKSVYIADTASAEKESSLKSLTKILRECVRSFDRAQNIVAMKTLPGLASAACSALDHMDVETLVATIAGDDTAFLLFKDNQAAEQFLREINSIIYNIGT